MARTRSARYDDIRKAILKKAAKLFADAGYARSSIADLVEACGISRGALYHYFDSKQAILFAILDNHVGELFAQVEAAIHSKGTVEEILQRVVDVVVSVNAGSPNEQRVLLNDLDLLSAKEQEAIKQLERNLVGAVADLLVRLDRHKRITKRTKKMYAMMLFGIINYTYIWYDPKGPVPPSEFARLAVEIFLDGFESALRPSVQSRSS
ncbi:MAG: TetR/AcrR family transcriptional regulator [Rhodospirillales bacterium]|nr:TetR/AcrR family transcriptional regulator [Rhodospirillales bacterium]